MNYGFYDAFNRPERTNEDAGPGTVTPIDLNGANRYALRALQDECDQLAVMGPDSGRNSALNRAAFKLSGFVTSGALDAQTVYDNLEAAARCCGLPQREIDTVLRDKDDGALQQGQQHPRQIPDPPAPPPVTQLDEAGSAAEPFAAPAGANGQDQTPDEAAVSTPSPEDVEQAREARRQQLLAVEYERQWVQREARLRLEAEQAVKDFREPPSLPTLTDELAVPDEPVTYTVSDLLPTGGNILLTAQYKTGKTTFVNALTRSLADHEPFLGKFDVAKLDGRIALFNYEVDERQYRRWLREVGITNTDQVVVLNLRGYRLPIVVKHIEDWVVQWLTERNVQVWAVDPFARAFTGCGKSENDNTEVGRFLDAIDVIKSRAGVSDLIMPTHTGREVFEEGQERARGATRLDDWADVRWFLTKDDNDVRYFRATGRDVEVAEEKLEFNEQTRALTMGGGDRAWEKRRRIEDAVVDAIRGEPGISLTRLRPAVRQLVSTASNEVIDNAVHVAERGHRIRVHKGSAGQASRHYPADATVIEG